MVGKAEFFREDVDREDITSGRDNLPLVSTPDHTTLVVFNDNSGIRLTTTEGDKVNIKDRSGNGGRMVVFVNEDFQSVITRSSRRKGDGEPGKWIYDSQGFCIGSASYHGRKGR
jgi:hypothetical protein